MVYEFIKVTQVVPVYEFGRFFFLIELDFFYSLFFSHIVKNKIVLEKSHVVKLYKVTKIKGCEETIVHSHILHYESQ
jgi:hypothetical protein